MLLYYQSVDVIAELISHFDDRYKAFAAALLMFAAGFAIWLLWMRSAHRIFMRVIAGAARDVYRIADGGETAANKLAAADKRLRTDASLGQVWIPYRRSLREDPRSTDEYLNPISPHAWFCVDRMPGRGYEKWASTFAGVFLTVGLLFTFVGLSAALFKVGNLGADTDQLRTAIFDILKISSAKFITSIAGILAFIAWTIASRRYMSVQSKAARQLADAVQMLSTPITPEAILLDQVTEVREQTLRLRTLGDEIRIGFQDTLTSVVGQRLDALPVVLEPALTGSLAPVVDALRKMGSNIGDANEAGIRGMVDGLLKQMHATAGSELASVAAAMREAAAELRVAKSGIGDSGTEFQRKLGEAADRMAATAASMSDVIDRRVGDLENRIKSIDASLVSGADTIGQVSTQMAHDMTLGLARAAEQVGTAASLAAAAARDGVQAQIGSVVETLRELVGEISRSATTSKEELVAGGRSAAMDLGSAVARAGDELTKKSEQAAGNLEAAFGRATESMVEGAEGALGRFGMITDILAERLREVGNSASTLGSAMRNQAEHMDHTSTAMAESGRTVATASDALRQSTVPVVSTLRAVEAAATQTNSALAAVQTIGEAMRQALEAINVASSAANLAFQSYEQRFGTVDEALGRTVARMRQELENLGDRATSVVQSLDKHLGDAVAGLAQGVGNLDDMVTNIGNVCGDIERIATRVEKSAVAMAEAD